jgi:hypothetical protein
MLGKEKERGKEGGGKERKEKKKKKERGKEGKEGGRETRGGEEMVLSGLS